MVKFVLDADASIKLAKAEILGSLTAFAQCFISRQVYDEVLKGKAKLYQDAFDIDKLVSNHSLKLAEAEYRLIEGLGTGECSSLALFTKIKAYSIISDDRKFLSVLEGAGIPFLISTDTISLLFIRKRISRRQALESLEKLKASVNEECYNSAKRIIGGK